MISEQVDEYLTSILSMYAPKSARGLTKRVAQKLAASGAEARVERACSFASAREALSKCGTVLAEDGHFLGGVLLSGAASMNPAFVALQVEPDHLLVKAYAKEGLIKQHTAERAIETLLAALFPEGALP